MQLVLIRHGQTDSNISGALDTAIPGAPLNGVGKNQAEDLVQHWIDAGFGAPDVLACSGLLRTKQTAAPLAAHFDMTVIEDTRFREMEAGELEMADAPEDQIRYLKVLGDWVKGNLDTCLPGGETGYETIERFRVGVTELAQEAKHVRSKAAGVLGEYRDDNDEEATLAIVCHGAIIRIFAALETEEVTLPLIAQHPVPNTSWAILEGEPGNWSARIWAGKPVDQWEIDESMTEVIPSRLLLGKK